MTEKKSINFTVVPHEPDDADAQESVYANFCAVNHTPFDFTLTFCEMHPLSEKDLKDAPEGETRTIRAPVKVKVVIPAHFMPTLGAVLQENFRMFQDSYSNVGWAKGKMGGKVH